MILLAHICVWFAFVPGDKEHAVVIRKTRYRYCPVCSMPMGILVSVETAISIISLWKNSDSYVE